MTGRMSGVDMTDQLRVCVCERERERERERKREGGRASHKDTDTTTAAVNLCVRTSVYYYADMF